MSIAAKHDKRSDCTGECFWGSFGPSPTLRSTSALSPPSRSEGTASPLEKNESPITKENQQHSDLDGDFQQTYQAAERAYGGGDYDNAHHLASELLEQLESQDQSDDDRVRDAVRGWRAFVTLLLGHIELHGRQRPDQAAHYYQLALDCQPQDTLADLARQGLQRSQNLPSMLQDPFLNNPAPASASGPSQSTAMPWLKEISSPPPTKTEPAPEPKRTDEPNQPVRSNPDITESVMTANKDSSHPEQPLPLLIAEESVESAWLRVSITPNKTRDDSIQMDQAKPSSRLKRLLRGLSRS